ncbi:hypothetical protein E8E11_000866 [Didymella keratinophila]|nr:hypothetical protein E8E11_000866 [Didymella keratinophila]
MCVRSLSFFNSKAESNINTRGQQGGQGVHAFFDYAATWWPTHFRKARLSTNEDSIAVQLGLEVSDPKSACFSQWARIYYDTHYDRLGSCDHHLTVAALFGHDVLVQILLVKGADVNAQNEENSDALQEASAGGYKEVVKMLLDHGADVNAQSGYHGNAVQAASSKGYEEVVKMLLSNGADVSGQSRHYAGALQSASAGGYEQVVKILLDNGVDVNAQGGKYGNALQAASARGYKEVVTMLLDKGANINVYNRKHSSALQVASSRGYEQVVNVLIDNGANINAQGGDYGNALLAASAEGHEQVVKTLLDNGADVNAQDEEYRNALLAASFMGHEQVVKTLLDNGADVNTQGGEYGNALQAASARGHEQVVKTLLDNGADVNAQGGDYGNALLAASAEGHEQVVKTLLDNGADVNAQDEEYRNALLAASAEGHEQVVKTLLDNGADVNAQCGEYGNALQAASARGHEQVVKTLLDNGANVNAQGGMYGNALHAAAYGGHTNIINQLTKSGVFLQPQDHYGRTTLWWAAAGGNASAVETLIYVQTSSTQPLAQRADLVRAILDKQLHAGQLEQQAAGRMYSNSSTKTEVSPWLEMTRWPRYFDGLDMTQVAPLAYGPNPITELALVVVGDSFDRIIEQAYRSICEDRISVFDQAKINSSMGDRSAKQERMIMVKLQKGTFRAYKNLWKRLLCFVYRTSLPSQTIPLLHRFTQNQLCELDRTTVLANEVLSSKDFGGAGRPSEEEKRQATADLDKACLQLCISLLDHTLRGDHFESVVLSFLAVLGIDEKPGEVFRSPLSYSPDLSKFIKMAQMLVVQRAVTGAEQGEAEHPSDILDEMRERFMVRGTRTAFDWVYRLRSYAKKVVSNTTSLGHMMWSEDAETVTYRDTSLEMTALRNFVASQVKRAQRDLEDLLLLHPEECRDEVVPRVALHRLKDDPSNSQKGWNFLQDPRNADQLRSGDDWLFNRVLDNDWLRDEMLSLTEEQQVNWKKNAVQAYFSKLDNFLEQILLLIHLTAGQPARGTELMSLQHSNTAQGHHRSIFIEEGLISTVTSYHKGYNITGSTKIIHRYRPKEVSELLVV